MIYIYIVFKAWSLVWELRSLVSKVRSPSTEVDSEVRGLGFEVREPKPWSPVFKVRSLASERRSLVSKVRSPSADFPNDFKWVPKWPLKGQPLGTRFWQASTRKVVGLRGLETGLRGFGRRAGRGVQRRGVGGGTPPKGVLTLRPRVDGFRDDLMITSESFLDNFGMNLRYLQNNF